MDTTHLLFHEIETCFHSATFLLAECFGFSVCRNESQDINSPYPYPFITLILVSSSAVTVVKTTIHDLS
jgi:hypothetical protein